MMNKILKPFLSVFFSVLLSVDFLSEFFPLLSVKLKVVVKKFILHAPMYAGVSDPLVLFLN